MNPYNITPTNKEFETEIDHKIDHKTKPLHSLGTLEKREDEKIRQSNKTLPTVLKSIC